MKIIYISIGRCPALMFLPFQGIMIYLKIMIDYLFLKKPAGV